MQHGRKIHVVEGKCADGESESEKRKKNRSYINIVEIWLTRAVYLIYLKTLYRV